MTSNDRRGMLLMLWYVIDVYGDRRNVRFVLSFLINWITRSLTSRRSDKFFVKMFVKSIWIC